MTKKDFRAIARILTNYEAAISEEWLNFGHDMVADFADWLATTNPRFDRERFLRACQRKGKPDVPFAS